MNNYNIILENIKHELRNEIKKEEKYIKFKENQNTDIHKYKIETLTEVLGIIAENEMNLM